MDFTDSEPPGLVEKLRSLVEEKKSLAIAISLLLALAVLSSLIVFGGRERVIPTKIIVLQDGEKLGGALVEVFFEGRKLASGKTVDGKVVFNDLPKGVLQARVSFSEMAGNYSLDLNAGDLFYVTLTQAKNSFIVLKAVDELGSPVDNASIAFEMPSESGVASGVVYSNETGFALLESSGV